MPRGVDARTEHERRLAADDVDQVTHRQVEQQLGHLDTNHGWRCSAAASARGVESPSPPQGRMAPLCSGHDRVVWCAHRALRMALRYHTPAHLRQRDQ